MFGRTNMNAAGLPATAITDEMAIAIDRWVALYYSKTDVLANNKLSMGLPASIAREMATLVTLEAQVNVGNAASAQDEEGEPVLNPRAEFIKETLKQVLDQLPVQTEYACAFGGVAFRPYIDGDAIAIDCINADNFYPTSFNKRGEITGAVFIEKKKQEKDCYFRMEEHRMGDNGTYLITNRAYKAMGNTNSANGGIGTPCPLTEVDEWRDISPEVELTGIYSPLFSYFRIPHGNVIDVDSPLGVSVYAEPDNAGILDEVDKQLQRLSWEYDGGQMAIDANVTAFKTDDEGHPILPEGRERLYRVNNLIDDEGSGRGKFDIFAPALRDSSYAQGLNRLLMRVEDMTGLARGTFSDANESVRTATELKISKQRTYATVTGIQKSLQDAIDKLAEAINIEATLYNLAPEGEYTITYAWDDSIVVDASAEREIDRADVLDGIMEAWEYRVKWYGETPAQAKAAVSGNKPVEEAVNGTEGEEEPEIE